MLIMVSQPVPVAPFSVRDSGKLEMQEKYIQTVSSMEKDAVCGKF
jgi:hypothetical protein